MNNVSNEFKLVKQFGLLVDGSMDAIKIGDWGVDEIRYVKEYLGTYGINWLQCYQKGKLAVSYNAQHVTYIEWEAE
jgi:hypothetical protein